jgi:hypothetical protein
LIGFSRPAMATVRDETRMPGDRCIRGSGYAPDRLVKAGFRAKLYVEFHIFLSVFNRRRQTAFL